MSAGRVEVASACVCKGTGRWCDQHGAGACECPGTDCVACWARHGDPLAWTRPIKVGCLACGGPETAPGVVAHRTGQGTQPIRVTCSYCGAEGGGFAPGAELAGARALEAAGWTSRGVLVACRPCASVDSRVTRR